MSHVEVAKPSWRRQRLEQLEKETGIVPIEALSSLSALILAFEPGSLEGSKDPAPIIQTVRIAVRDLAGIGELQSRKSNLALRAKALLQADGACSNGLIQSFPQGLCVSCLRLRSAFGRQRMA